MSDPNDAPRNRSTAMKSTEISFATTRRPRARRVRRIALLLATVWVLPTLLCAAETLPHAIDHDSHEVVSLDERVSANAVEDDHGHRHRELDPLVSPERTKEFKTPVVAQEISALPSAEPITTPHAEPATGLAVGFCLAVAGPRAPPLS